MNASGRIKLYVGGVKLSDRFYGSVSHRRNIIENWDNDYRLHDNEHYIDISPKTYPKQIKSKTKILHKRKGKAVIDNVSGEIYESVIQASIVTGVNYYKLYESLTGRTENKTTLKFYTAA